MLKCLHCAGYEVCKKYGDLDKAHLCNGPVETLEIEEPNIEEEIEDSPAQEMENIF